MTFSVFCLVASNDLSIKAFCYNYLMTVGLKRGTVRLADYDESWPTEFSTERQSIW